MRTPSATSQPAPQLPCADEMYLDHVGHFVDGAEAAADALGRAGFTPTSASVQFNPDPAGGPPRLTGTGNVCAMLRGGYLEMLFKTADTPLGAEFDQARARYKGLHLVAFAIADAAASHRRLEHAGFPMQPLVAMQRPVETAEGPGIAAFEVVRLAPGVMPEGRVQVLRHLTEHTVWQPRWLDHPNGARCLRSIVIVVADVAEATERFSRFTGRPSRRDGRAGVIALDRGTLEFVDSSMWNERWLGMAVPSLPFMAQCVIEVASLDRAKRCLEAGGFAPQSSAGGLSIPFPDALGHGIWTFVAPL